MTVLADVEPAAHGGSLAVLVRLGPLLALAFIVLSSFALARARGSRTPATSIRRAGALVLGAAGLLHLALVPEHLRQGASVGSFFLAAGLAQVTLAALAWRRTGALLVGAVLAVTGGLVGLYGASRLWALPLGMEREEVDAIGLLTKSLELLGSGLVVAATRSWRVAFDHRRARAALTLGTALAARPVFALGPRPLQLAAVVVAALTASAILGRRPPRNAATPLADAAVFSLLVRGDGLSPYLIGGVALPLLRQLPGTGRRPVVAPVAVAALGVLTLPGTGARLEILHVAHADEPVAWLVGLTIAAAAVLLAAATRAVPVIVAFYAAHLALQGVRLFAGRTSIEAIEVPAASLGLLFVAVFVLGDPALRWERTRFMAGAGVLAGGADVLLRDLGVRYPALFAVAGVVAAVGVWSHLRARPPSGRRRDDATVSGSPRGPTTARSATPR
jgi:hypothetical protein